MKTINFTELSNEELIDTYVNAKGDLFGLKFQLSVGQLADTNKIDQAKRTIARALTEMNKRKIDANKIKMPVVKKDKKGSKKKAKKAEAKAEAKKAEPKKEVKASATEVKKEEPKAAAKKTEVKAEPKKTETKAAPAAKPAAKAAPKAKKEGK